MQRTHCQLACRNWWRTARIISVSNRAGLRWCQEAYRQHQHCAKGASTIAAERQLVCASSSLSSTQKAIRRLGGGSSSTRSPMLSEVPSWPPKELVKAIARRSLPASLSARRQLVAPRLAFVEQPVTSPGRTSPPRTEAKELVGVSRDFSSSCQEAACYG